MQRTKPISCTDCSCYFHGTDFSSIEGTGSSGVMLVGEASGEMEARQGTPFVSFAPAGSVLERVFKRMGLDRQQVSITNVLRCRPKNNFLDGAPWEYSALNHCRPNLDAAIRERRPKCIVALGGIATRELTGMTGTARGVTHLAGYVLPSTSNHVAEISGLYKPTGQIPVVPNFHPSYLRRGKASHQGVFSRILQRALNIAKGGDKNYLWNVEPEDEGVQKELKYQIHPSLDDGASFAAYIHARPSLVVSYDVETSESVSLDEDAREGFADTQLRIAQFSVEGLGSIALPWDGGYKAIIHAILHTPNVKCGHNVWLFDNKVLRAVGEREGVNLMPDGAIHDTLQMLHHWQPDLPAHLQFAAQYVSFPFPWKHLAGTDLEFYGCCDVDATLRLYNMLERTLKRDLLWGDETIGYVGQVYNVRPVLEGMELRGVPIDDEERVKLGAEFDKAQLELLEEINALVPSGCGRVHPKEGYKGVPPEVKVLVAAGLALASESFPEFENIEQRRFKESGDDGESYCYKHLPFSEAIIDGEGNPQTTAVLRWCRVYDFNPNSRNQVLAYMKAKGHPVPKDRQREDDNGGNPDTTKEIALRRLANKTGDMFYIKVVEYRGFTKLKGTYIEGFKPGPDGCVHPTFTFDTAIGQLSARNPNSQNFTKLKPTPKLAKAMRRMIAAKPGKVITEWDYKSFHVLTLGFLAEDPTWMRLARLDMHSFFAGHVLGLWDGFLILTETDAQLMARFDMLKSNPEWKLMRDGQFKRCTLGIGNGLSAKGLYERYMEDFPSQKCKMCAGSGKVPGIRTLKKCVSCHGTGFVTGLRIVEEIMDALYKLAPRIFAYQRGERKSAHERGDRGFYTPFGFARRFYEVYVFNKHWNPVRDLEPPRGDQAEQAVSYRHTNIAHCHLREVMKELHRKGLDEKYGLYNQIHDSLQFHFDERLLEEHASEIRPIMLAPSKVLRNATAPEGLVVGVEGAWGKSWAEMKGLDAGVEVKV